MKGGEILELKTKDEKDVVGMLNSPINRMGGKSRLRKTIIGMLPKHICYVELFFGAG